MDVLTKDVMCGSLTELLYADNLVLCGKSLNKVMGKYERWKNAVEGKGLRLKVNKTKCMRLLFGKKSSVLNVDPSGVCGEQLIVILFSVPNVRGGLIVVVLMCLGR